MKFADSIQVENRRIGLDEPVFLIAEIGYNFNTLDEARRSVVAAAEAGADAVKFQTFHADTVTTRKAHFPIEAGDTNQYDEFKRYELSEQWHRELFDLSRQCGMVPFSTPAYYDDVDFLESIGQAIHKVGSDDATNLPFVEYVARLGKPLIVSTGMCTMAESAELIETVRAAGNDKLIVLHCLSNYPVRDLSQVNLRAMTTLARSFGVLAGFSDHTEGVAAATAAAALGAVVIEKHFTLDKSLDAPDAPFSADPAEFRAIAEAVRQVETLLGDGLKRPADTERDMIVHTRKSLIARRDIPAGKPLDADDIIIKRPGLGIPPRNLPTVLGRPARRDIPADEPVTWSDV